MVEFLHESDYLNKAMLGSFRKRIPDGNWKIREDG